MTAWTAAYEHVISRLTDSDELFQAVGGRIYQGAVPAAGVEYPLVLVQPYGDATDILRIGPLRAATALEVAVRVIAPDTSLTVLEGLAGLLDEALNATGPATLSRGHVASCVRTVETDMTELSDGQVWRYVGGRYRLLLTASS